MKTNLTSSLTIQVDQELRATPASSDHSTTGANGFAVALFVRRSHENTGHPPSEPAPRPAPANPVQVSPDLNALYKCKNCGRRMKLSDATNYYGLPACPACVQACAPFELIPDPSDFRPESDGKASL